MATRFLITGCGRSGTRFISETLTASGVPCGHEAVFTPTGMRPWNESRGESSWFAAARLPYVPERVPVIHVVRHPRAVAASWYRLGLFTPLSWRLVVKGRPTQFLHYMLHPRAFAGRLAYVYAQRRLLMAATPTVHDQSGELNRIYRYWVDWNQLIERQTHKLALPYLRVRLEDIDWSALERHIGQRLCTDKTAPDGDRENKKLHYPPRPMPNKRLPSDVVELAQRYGYNLVE